MKVQPGLLWDASYYNDGRAMEFTVLYGFETKLRQVLTKVLKSSRGFHFVAWGGLDLRLNPFIRDCGSSGYTVIEILPEMLFFSLAALYFGHLRSDSTITSATADLCCIPFFLNSASPPPPECQTLETAALHPKRRFLKVLTRLQLNDTKFLWLQYFQGHTSYHVWYNNLPFCRHTLNPRNPQCQHPLPNGTLTPLHPKP